MVHWNIWIMGGITGMIVLGTFTPEPLGSRDHEIISHQFFSWPFLSGLLPSNSRSQYGRCTDLGTTYIQTPRAGEWSRLPWWAVLGIGLQREGGNFFCCSWKQHDVHSSGALSCQCCWSCCALSIRYSNSSLLAKGKLAWSSDFIVVTRAWAYWSIFSS